MGRFSGFRITIGQVGKVVTTNYPEEKRAKPTRFHGRHVLNRYEGQDRGRMKRCNCSASISSRWPG